MAGKHSITVSFRLNLDREEDWEIQKYFFGDTIKVCYGDKSKFIKSALIRAIQGIKRDEEDTRLVCEMNTQRTKMGEMMTSEADRVINAVKKIVQDEAEQFVKLQAVKGNQVVSEMEEPVGKVEPMTCFGEVPERADEDVSEDVLAFLSDL